MSIQRCQYETSSSEFSEWCYYLGNIEPNDTGKNEWYLAQIAAEIKRLFKKKPNKIKVKDSLIKFVSNIKKKSKQISKEENCKRSKAYWNLFLKPHIK